MALFIWKFALVLEVSALTGLDILAVTEGVLDIFDIIQSFDHWKLSSILHLIKDKSRDLQSYPNILIFKSFSYYFCLVLKISVCCCLFVVYTKIICIIFKRSIILFISIKILQISWCHIIIVTICQQIVNQLNSIKILSKHY